MTAMKINQLCIHVALGLTSVAMTGVVVMASLNDEPAEKLLERHVSPPEHQPTRAAVPELRESNFRFEYAVPNTEPGEPSSGRTASSEQPRLEDRKPADVVIANPESWSVDVTASRRALSVKPSIDTAAHKKSRRPIRYSLQQRLQEIEPGAQGRLVEKFSKAKVNWPPTEVAFLAVKDERYIELHARSGIKDWTFIHRYPVRAASGDSGPKLRRGDRQVPEGIYRITYLNPNSRYHVSMRVNYPNEFDRKMAAKDGRRDLGGDIMIHGKKSSAGCLAIGDPAAEELFVLTALVGKPNVRLIIAPTDFRKKKPVSTANAPPWLGELYSQVASEMSALKAPKPPSLLSLLGL